MTAAVDDAQRSSRFHVVLAVSVARLIALLPAWPMTQILVALSRDSRPSHVHEVSNLRSAICRSSVRCAGQGCLQRSIAVFVACRLDGHTPVWASGFRVAPFAAHAWVEAEGVPVGEPDEVAEFVVVLSVPERSLEPGSPSVAGGGTC